MLLSQPAAGMLDLPAALRLYQQAWQDGVTFAAFELGHLYESGVGAGTDRTPQVLAADRAQAWSWYLKAAQVAQPSALARLGEEEDAAAYATRDTPRRDAHLCSALGLYTAAAESARLEDWPDAAWKNWRYRRASLARLLAREGMMGEVAGVYDLAVRRPSLPLESGTRGDLVRRGCPRGQGF
jgi:TPR repeat protein